MFLLNMDIPIGKMQNEVYKLLQFSLTIPTGSVKSKRSISTSRRVFNYNRTTMQLNRLGQMCLLAIESGILESITNNDVIDYFASLKPKKCH